MLVNESAQFERALLAASIVVFLTSAGLFVARSAPLVMFPHEVRYGEAVLLDQARRVCAEPGLYPEVGKAPYLIDNYPPVFPLLMALVPCPDGAPYFGGRLLSLLATLAAACAIALVVRREAGNAAALLAAACFLAHTDVNAFGALARIDALALAFGLTGFAALFSQRTSVRLLAVALFFLGVYTRHAMLLFPVAGSLLLLLREGPSALRWPLALLAAGITFFLAGTWWTDGGMYDHIIYYNVLPFSWMDVARKWFQSTNWWHLPLLGALFVALLPRGDSRGSIKFWWFGYGALVAALVVLEASIQFRPPAASSQELFEQVGVPRAWQFAILAACALVALRSWRSEWPVFALGRAQSALLVLLGMASAVQVGRDGSDVNYFLELDATLAIVAGAAFAGASIAKRAALAALLAASVLGQGIVLEERPTHPERLARIASFSERVLDYVAKFEGLILSEEPWVLAEHGRPLSHQTFMYTALTSTGQWDAAPLIEEIRARKYVAIVRVAFGEGPVGKTWAGDRSFPRAIRDEIEKHYAPDPAGVSFSYAETKLWWKHISVWVPKT